MDTTVKTVKVPNYTPAQTAEMVAAYKANPTKDTVAAFATKFGKTSRSIVAKLSREKVYVAAEYKTKTGATPIAKEKIVAAIAGALNVDAEKMGGMEKANKNALLLILARLMFKPETLAKE